MSNGNALVRLWLIIEGPSGDARVVGATHGAPRRGRRVEVMAPASVLETRVLWLLARKDPADIVLAVDAERAPLESRRTALGKVADQYEVSEVPVLERAKS